LHWIGWAFPNGDNNMTFDHHFVRALPGCYLLLRPFDDFRIMAATDAYLKATRTSPDIVGRPLFDVFPDNPLNPTADGVKNLTLSLRKVIETKAVHRMAVQRYDTKIPDSNDFEIRYWIPTNIPILDDNGKINCIIHAVEEITDRIMLRQFLVQRDKKVQQQISDAISTTQELERMEISKELHDNINQILLTSRLYLGRALERENPEKSLISTSLQLVEKAIEEIRSLSAALVKTSEEEENMMQAIESLLNNVIQADSIRIHKNIEIPDESLIESKVKVAVFRIIQEQLSNVIKHAEAKNLYITIEFEEKNLNITIRDDGKGFSLADRKTGLGFQNMKSRVAVMDGAIHIHSQPGDGCTIQVSIPLPDSQLSTS
jgi:signal transduction histidine kinase